MDDRWFRLGDHGRCAATRRTDLMKPISTFLPILLVFVAMTLAVARPQGIGNYKIAVYRLLVGVCHWDGAGSAGITWMTDPWFFIGGIYDDGELLGDPST